MVKNISKYRLVEDLHIAFVHMAKHAHIAPQPLPTYLNGHINTTRKVFPNQLTGLITHRANTMVYVEKQIGERPTHCICAHAQTRTHCTSTITHLPWHINTSRKLLPNQLTGLIHIRPIPWYMYHGEKHFEKQSGTPTHCICAHAQTCTHFTAAITHLH